MAARAEGRIQLQDQGPKPVLARRHTSCTDHASREFHGVLRLLPDDPCDRRKLQESIAQVSILSERTSKTLTFDHGNKSAELSADGSRHRKASREMLAAENLLPRTWHSLNLKLATRPLKPGASPVQARCKPSSAVRSVADCRIILRLGI